MAVNPHNKFFVTIDNRFKDKIVTESGLAIYQDTTFRPGWHATVNGKVHSVPKNLIGKYPIEVGDEVAFSYLVVFDQVHKDNRYDVFHEDAPLFANLTTWSNRRGMIISRQYMMNDVWEVVVFDVEKTVYEKERGGYDLVESVMGKYPFAETNDIHFKNILPYRGCDYWMVDEPFLFAVKKEGEIVMLQDFVIMEIPPAPTSGRTIGGLILPIDKMGRADNELHAKIAYLPDNGLGLKVGDIAVVDKRKVQPFTFWEKDYLLVRLDQIVATA